MIFAADGHSQQIDAPHMNIEHDNWTSITSTLFQFPYFTMSQNQNLSESAIIRKVGKILILTDSIIALPFSSLSHYTIAPSVSLAIFRLVCFISLTSTYCVMFLITHHHNHLSHWQERDEYSNNNPALSNKMLVDNILLPHLSWIHLEGKERDYNDRYREVY